MITLYQFPRMGKLPNLSPFCAKLETYLRMSGLSYECKFVRNPGKGPKGKLPFINDGGMVVADSSLIIQYLMQKYGDNIDAHLSAKQRAESLAIQRMLEEHLLWTVIYSRWVDPQYWPVWNHAIFGELPWFLRYLVPALLQRKVKRDLHGQGIGRHTRDEVYMLGKQDIVAFATILADKPYVHGDQPSSIDACAYGFFCGLLMSPFDSPLKQYAASQANLVAYVQRMHERYFSDLID